VILSKFLVEDPATNWEDVMIWVIRDLKLER
jgi:hypothetical protein